MARAERGVGLAPKAAQVASAGVRLLAARAYQCVLVWVSENVGASPVAADNDTLADEDDADARSVQLVLFPQVALDGVRPLLTDSPGYPCGLGPARLFHRALGRSLETNQW